MLPWQQTEIKYVKLQLLKTKTEIKLSYSKIFLDN